MKKIIVFVLLFLVATLTVSSVMAYSESAEKEILTMLKSKGFSNVFVSTDNDNLFIQLGFDVIPKNISSILVNSALDGFKKFENAQNILVEACTNDDPVLGVYIRGIDANDYLKGILSEDDFTDLVAFLDLRSSFKELSDDLLDMNAFVENISFQNDTLSAIIRYNGDKQHIASDTIGMLYLAVQDCPYAKEIALKFRNEDNNLSVVQAKTDDILALFNNSITPEEFAKRTKVYKESSSKQNSGIQFINSLKNIFKGTQNGNMPKNVNGIAGGALFLLSIVFFLVAKNRKRRIAFISKARRISLSNFPNKRRVYGKFVGKVEAENPLKAPFSQKDVVMFGAELLKLEKERDPDGNNRWVPVWKDKKITNFKVKELRGNNGVLIRGNGSVPKIDLPITFNKIIRDKNDPIIQPFLKHGILSFLSHHSFRAKERALENGRKVFFLGGIQRGENEFEFIPHPHLINMLSIHSERRLTGHYRKIAGWLTFFGIILLLGSAYLLLAYFGIV